MISIIILAVVFVLIAVRQIGNVKLQIWQIMLGGAIAVLIIGQISFTDAFGAINFDVIIFLFGMFVVGEALEKSGYLAHISYNFFKSAKSANTLLLFVIFGMGIISVFLMNDTVAIIGTPVVLMLAEKNKIPPKLMLIALAFAVTTGSVMSPIGNPQNLLIAVNGNLNNGFTTFAKYLFVPTIINLFLAFAVLKIFFRNEIHTEILNHIPETITDTKLSVLSKLSLIIILALIFIKIMLIFLEIPFNFKLTYIAIAACLPIILFSPKRISILKRIDWHTILFFAAMFILMQSVWNSGFFQRVIHDLNLNITSSFMILTVSVFLSQLISNVPLVALYLPMLIHLGVSTNGMMALATGSTVAGNLFILGAASNIIIIQNAEKRNGETISFLEFAKVGIPFTILNVLTYYFYLKLF
jgi:Na+/H+ antiporter NhaD/arsenite permease-like protein